jgi:beta-glucuronidase
MKQDTDNFVGCIHDEDYLKKFLTCKLDNTGMINDVGRNKESLNGMWNFSIDPYDNCLRSRWYLEIDRSDDGMMLPLDYDFDLYETIHVPSCWNLHSKEYFWYEGPAIYTKKFRYKNRGEKKVLLKVGAANYVTRVFLNKKFLGYHKGGSTPFYVDITDELQEQNRILVVVDNTRHPDNVPMQNTDWFNYGGLYRDVELIRLPEVFIKDFTVGLVTDGLFDKIKVDVETSLPIEGEVMLDIRELGISKKIKVTKGVSSSVIEAKPELWSPDNPKLYEINLTYANDHITDMIGFREIRVDGTDIILNGKKIFMKGICAHEESVANGKAVTEEEISENFMLAKELGCNFMRLAHYPHTEKAAMIADRMGMMLWEEVPVYWGIDFDNKDTYADAENQLAELVKRDRNRASVVVWSVGNENADTDARLLFMKSLALKAKELDPSRLVTAACLVDHKNLMIDDRLSGYLDIIGINEYYGWYDPDFEKLKKIFGNSKPVKPVIISEFGADAKAGERGSRDDLWTEDKQLDIYEKQIEVISSADYVKGVTPWILYDFRCPRRNNPFQRFYNRKGLLSADKKLRKLAFFRMKKFYEGKK